MQIIVDIQREQDLPLLLSLLERMGIAHYQAVVPKNSKHQEKSTDEIADKKKNGNLNVTVPASIENSTFLPIDSIKSIYPNQWVLIANPQKEGRHLLGGQVLLFDHDKREFALKAKELIRTNVGLTHFFTGELPRQGHIGLARKSGSK